MKNALLASLVLLSVPSLAEVPPAVADREDCSHLQRVPSLEDTSSSPDDFKKYVIDPNVIQRLSCEARVTLDHLLSWDTPRNEAYKTVLEEFYRQLRRLYPSYITAEPKWFFNIAGGALVQITILTCNMAEYLIVFSNPNGTEGYSGKFEAELWDFVIDGHIEDFGLGEFESKIYKPGDYTYMTPGDSQGFILSRNHLTVEYGRGRISRSVRFGIFANKKNLGPEETRAQVRECAKVYFETTEGRRKLRRAKR